MSLSTLEAPEASGAHSAGTVYGRLLGAAAVIVAADQATKALAIDRLSDGPVDLIEGAVSLRLTTNSGGVFGLGQGYPAFFLVATMVVTAAILLWARRIEDASWLIPLGLVIGGGIGNLVDRVFRDLGGGVVDFIDLHVWPVFNVADAAIVTGVGLILLSTFRSDDAPKADGPATDDRP